MPDTPIRLTEAASAFVTDRHLAILSTPTPAPISHPITTSRPAPGTTPTPALVSRIHSVPVGFTFENGVVRIITSDGTQKVRNAERSELRHVGDRLRAFARLARHHDHRDHEGSQG